jgi:hypothetical protein
MNGSDEWERRRADTCGTAETHRERRLLRQQDEVMDSATPDQVPEEPTESLAEFFDRIEREGGAVLDDEDHRLIIETNRMDRDRHH